MPKNKQWYKIEAMQNGIAEIYIYDEIGYWGLTAKDFARDLKDLKNVSEIHLRVNSPGGSVFDGIAIYNLLRSHAANVIAYIDGIAASMASVIVMAANKIIMPENALLMIHNPLGGAMGEAEELRKTADLLDKVKTALISAYVAKTEMDEATISDLMDAETFITANEALEMGFVNEVDSAIEIAACFDFSSFKNAPKSLLDSFKNSGESTIKVTGDVHSNNAERLFEDIQKHLESKDKSILNHKEENVMPKTVEGKTPEQLREDIKAQETKRRNDIKAAFKGFDNCDTILNECLDDMDCSLDSAREKLLNHLGNNSKPIQGGFHGHIDNGKSDKQAATLAISARAGLSVDAVDLKDTGQYRNMTLFEIARAMLGAHGVGTASFDRMGLVGAAFTHSSGDFGSLLMDVAHKAMLRGFDEAGETFQRWTRKGTLTDFKIANRVGLDSFPNLMKVPEGGEYKYATLGDRKAQIALATYGRLFSITRQTIINDDLDALARVPSLMGRAAIRTVGNLVYAVLTSNQPFNGGDGLFHASRKNLQTGGGSALSITSLDKGRQMMALQTLGDDEHGSNIRPSFLLTPVALGGTARQLMESTSDPDGKHANVKNKVHGMAEPIDDARLDTASETAWYLIGGAETDTIEVAYLDGNDRPYLEQQGGFEIDGVASKVRIDAGVAPMSDKAIHKSNGQ